jgi:hypothetical protein
MRILLIYNGNMRRRPSGDGWGKKRMYARGQATVRLQIGINPCKWKTGLLS